LEALAERGRVVPELDDPGVRELLVGSYRLIYEVGPESVHVLALNPWRTGSPRSLG
jgi:hypothetical protein